MIRFLLLVGLLACAARAEVSTSEIEADKRPIILFDTFGFSEKGHIDMVISDVVLELPENNFVADKSLMGFFIATAEAELSLQMDFEQGRCVLDDPHVYKLFTLKDAAEAHANNNSTPFSFEYSVPDAKEFSLFFANCQRHVRVSMNVKFSLYNIDLLNKVDYLSAGGQPSQSMRSMLPCRRLFPSTCLFLRPCVYNSASRMPAQAVPDPHPTAARVPGLLAQAVPDPRCSGVICNPAHCVRTVQARRSSRSSTSSPSWPSPLQAACGYTCASGIRPTLTACTSSWEYSYS